MDAEPEREMRDPGYGREMARERALRLDPPRRPAMVDPAEERDGGGATLRMYRMGARNAGPVLVAPGHRAMPCDPLP